MGYKNNEVNPKIEVNRNQQEEKKSEIESDKRVCVHDID